MAPAGDCNLAVMPFTHRGHGPEGFEVPDMNQAPTQTSKMCIFAQNPELLSLFASGGTDAHSERLTGRKTVGQHSNASNYFIDVNCFNETKA